jgi:GNAT superfamily N-acetyltransferase
LKRRVQPFEYNNANLIAALSFYGTTERRAGMTLVTSPVEHSAFNVAVIDAPPPDQAALLACVDQAARHFRRLLRGWNFYACEDLLGARAARQLDDLLDPFGLVRILDAPGMEAQDLAAPSHPLPDLDFEPVANARERQAFTGLIAAAFHIPYPTARVLYEPEERWRCALEAWVGYFDGQPVTCGAAVEHAGALGIYSVATLANHRRRGCAEAVVRHAVAQRRQRGFLGPLVLQSTPDGRRLYRALGFRRTTRFAVYATA